MAEVPRSSFIPKQHAGAVPAQVKRKRRFNVFSLLSTILIVAALLSAGVAYGYRELTKRSLEESRQALTAERESFNEAEIAEVRNTNRRLSAARHLLNNHLSPTKVFEALQIDTLVPVQLTSFAYSRNDEGGASVSLTGVTDEFGIISLQSRQLGGSAILGDYDVSSIGANIGETTAGGNERTVTFSVNTFIPSEQIRYQPNQNTQTQRNSSLLQNAQATTSGAIDVSVSTDASEGGATTSNQTDEGQEEEAPAQEEGNTE